MITIQGNNNEPVDATADGEILVAPTRNTSKAGIVALAAESAPETDQQGTRLIRALEANADSRMRMVFEKCLYRRTWTNSTIPHDVYTDIATLVVAYNGLSGGGMRLDSTSVTTNLARASVFTYHTFRAQPEGMIYASGYIAWSAIVTNATWSFGLASSIPGQFLPQSGIYIRRNAAGTLQFVVRRNEVDLYVEDISEAGYALLDYHRVVIGVSTTHAECWIDDELVAHFAFDGTDIAKPYLYNNSGMRLHATRFNESLTSGGCSLYVAEWSVWESGDGAQQTEEISAALRGATAPNLPSAQGSSSSTAYANSTIPTSLTLSNTTCSLATTQSGGLLRYASIAGADTDYILVAYSPHDAFIGDAQDVFVITGVNISAWNMGAANSATVPTTLVFGIGYGSTGISLATTDGAATKMTRRIAVGSISIPINAVVGQTGDKNINYQLQNPVPVNSTELAHVIMRIVSGAATASQQIHMNVQLTGFWI